MSMHSRIQATPPFPDGEPDLFHLRARQCSWCLYKYTKHWGQLRSICKMAPVQCRSRDCDANWMTDANGAAE